MFSPSFCKCFLLLSLTKLCRISDVSWMKGIKKVRPKKAAPVNFFVTLGNFTDDGQFTFATANTGSGSLGKFQRDGISPPFQNVAGYFELASQCATYARRIYTAPLPGTAELPCSEEWPSPAENPRVIKGGRDFKSFMIYVSSFKISQSFAGCSIPCTESCLLLNQKECSLTC